MIYSSFSLCGDWEMHYTENAYRETTLPQFNGTIIKDAVPGYWEDMIQKFEYTPFFGQLKINPEYGVQQYPIMGTAPDMALPNIMGNFYYRRSFYAENITAPSVIHFSGVQNAVSVWLNGTFLGRHEGYSTPFEVEIPSGVLANGENVIVLSVSNHRLEGYAGEPVSGLTSRAANEYTGGITGEIELWVYSSPLRDAALFVAEDLKSVTVNVESTNNCEFSWAVYDDETIIKSGNANGDFIFDTEALALWSPESPALYTLEITCGDATLTRKFGVRRLVADGVHFRLNNVPYFLRGICEHCYFPETIHPHHDIAYYRELIKKLKSLGFNFMRFHTYIPAEEYMQAADELGMLLHVESPNNTTVEEWKEIVNFCRRHTSVVIYCCGNELLMDEPFIAHLNKCADEVHKNTDSLFSPFSALRGLEYCWVEPDQQAEISYEPFKHHPRRFKTVGAFSDLYSSFANELLSYKSLDADVAKIDDWSRVYNKPRVSHEICIDGTYTDLSLMPRYEGTRVGKTDMFKSIERHLKAKGVLAKAPTYFKNSSEWQRRIRKYCFEATRRCNNMAGYDFLGPIDTHWHTFGYDVGMMNEFYELKPGETIRNVLMYNSETVLLTDLEKKTNFLSGQEIKFGVYTSYYGAKALKSATLSVRIMMDNKVIIRRNVTVDSIENGKVSLLYNFSEKLPEVSAPAAMKLYITLEGDELFAENEWELYIFPESREVTPSENVVISSGTEYAELEKLLQSGKTVVIFGTKPFDSLPTTFRISLAGRTSGNLATVIYDHPVLNKIPHEGFCGWQFAPLLEGGSTICFESNAVPFNPSVEVASTHKFVIRQSAFSEFNVLGGKLLVCGFNFENTDPATIWLKNEIIAYASSDDFEPAETITGEQLHILANSEVVKAADNTNVAFNPNDKTATRKKK